MPTTVALLETSRGGGRSFPRSRRAPPRRPPPREALALAEVVAQVEARAQLARAVSGAAARRGESNTTAHVVTTFSLSDPHLASFPNSYATQGEAVVGTSPSR